MHRSRWFWIAGGILALTLAGCKCGKDKEEKPETSPPEQEKYQSTVSRLPGAKVDKVAALIPKGASLVVLSGNVKQFIDWMETRSWYKQLMDSPPMQDIRATGTMLRLSTLKHRLESVSAVRFGEGGLAELMVTPIGLAARLDGKKAEVLVVKQIDLKVQALDRLVEVLNQITPKKGIISSREIKGLKLRDLTLSQDNHLYYLLFSNLLLASNSEEYLLEAVGLAQGESQESLTKDETIGPALLEDQEKYDVVSMVDLTGMPAEGPGWISYLVPAEQLILRLTTGDKPRLDVSAILGEGGGEGKDRNVTSEAGKIIPLDSRLVLGLADANLRGIWKGLVERVEKPKVLIKRMKVDVKTELIDKLESHVVLVLGGADLSSKRPVPHLVALMKTRESAAVEAGMEKLFTYLFGSRPKKNQLKDMSGKVMYTAAGKNPFSPSFALVDGWLAIGTTPEMVRRIVATSIGQKPSINDLAGFNDKVSAASRPYFMLSYVDCGLLFEDLKSYAQTIIQKGDRFEPDAVENTMVPFLDALKQMGKLGGALTQKGGGATGTVVPL